MGREHSKTKKVQHEQRNKPEKANAGGRLERPRGLLERTCDGRTTVHSGGEAGRAERRAGAGVGMRARRVGNSISAGLRPTAAADICSRVFCVASISVSLLFLLH